MEQINVSKLADILRVKKKTDEEIIKELEMLIQQQVMYGGCMLDKLEFAIHTASQIPFVFP
jgi:hypothetical protein